MANQHHFIYLQAILLMQLMVTQSLLTGYSNAGFRSVQPTYSLGAAANLLEDRLQSIMQYHWHHIAHCHHV